MNKFARFVVICAVVLTAAGFFADAPLRASDPIKPAQADRPLDEG